MTVVVFGGERRGVARAVLLGWGGGSFGHPELAGVNEVVGHLPQFDVQLLHHRGIHGIQARTLLRLSQDLAKPAADLYAPEVETCSP